MTLETITADALTPLRHGFFTRKGGASSGIFEGLNCGYGSSDQANIVEINRARAVHVVGSPLDHLVGINQTHSPHAITVDAPIHRPWPDADALVTRTPDLVLSVLTADCAPVLFADTEAGVIGAAHAGWRGALAGVLEATLDAMETLGADRGAINAVIGPTISQRVYEVGPEFLDTFLTEDQVNGRFFANGSGDRLHFDLPAFILHRLREARISHAEWTRHCTYSDPQRFFSYRRSVHKKEADYGRLISLIRL
ncbi:MAG: peptidoglycan editing factor PgeF [Rhodobacteraceae bacterium]|nr:peptidoglycan editing factor PgeF [Paracoccaceae bacterium]